MPGYFIDTSALVKLYHDEVGAEAVREIFADSQSTCFISRLCVLETQSALIRKIRERQIDKEQFSIYRTGKVGRNGAITQAEMSLCTVHTLPIKFKLLWARTIRIW